MKERSISVTEASRNFAECINRVRYQGLSFLLLKNGTAVARLLPATGPTHRVIEGSSQPEEPQSLPAPTPVTSLPGPERLQLTTPAATVHSLRDQRMQW